VTLEEILRAIESSPLYAVALVFFAFYPIVSSVMWTSTATAYYLRREYQKDRRPMPLREVPTVSILIPTYCEELHIEATIRAVLDVRYPDFEVVVVDDGSTDGTVERVLPFAEAGRVRLITKEQNEGKAMALNDAIPVLRGEIILILDADAVPQPDVLQYLVPHFEAPRVAAVTANPQVVERHTFLAKLQTIEFTSIVSILRRAQRVWGRVLTVSGVATAFRRSAILDVGMFSPDMATEDIDMTWKLQKRFYDVRYEPGAMVRMRVPVRLRGLWRQRRRWATGLAQVLRRHGWSVLTSWKRRRMWPVLVEATLSIGWAYCFLGLTSMWIVSYAAGHPPSGASPLPNWWGMVIATLSLIQLSTGVLLDSRYDRTILRFLPVAILYPIVYWMLMAVITAISTPLGLLGRKHRGRPTRWQTPRLDSIVVPEAVEHPTRPLPSGLPG
jgi:biofilm PGA synthesis N-glycosyltransferase PgaC